MEHMPDARMIAAKTVASLQEGALCSVDTLRMLGRMGIHEMQGLLPLEALDKALREEN